MSAASRGRGAKGLVCVVLAAGLGTRMRSGLPKVLHPIFDRPMIEYALEALGRLGPERTVVVVGSNVDSIRGGASFPKGVEFAVQPRQMGTAHALSCGLDALGEMKRAATVLVTNGDTPLLTPATLRRFLALHRRGGSAVSMLSFTATDPSAYGRVVRDSDGSPLAIVEENDANPEQRKICEVNSGVYALEPPALPLVRSIRRNRKKGEYYLTDIIEAARGKGLRVGVHCVGREEEEFLGVNTRADLARAQRGLGKRTVSALQGKGVSFIDPETAYVAPSVRVGPDTVVYPNVCLHGRTRLGRGCTVYPNSRIVDSSIADGAVVKDSTLIEGSTVGRGAQVGPFAHLRPGSRIGPGARIGNFVETKNSSVGRGTKAMHLSYIGDASLGSGVNVGAGTITCNYDGLRKHRTSIGDGVFIGSDTQLVAPVKVGKGAFIGAGSTITKDVPPDSLALSRAEQTVKKGWARNRKKK